MSRNARKNCADLAAWYKVSRDQLSDQYHKALCDIRRTCTHAWYNWKHVHSSGCGIYRWDYIRECVECGLTESQEVKPDVTYKIEDVFEDNPLDNFL